MQRAIRLEQLAKHRCAVVKRLCCVLVRAANLVLKLVLGVVLCGLSDTLLADKILQPAGVTIHEPLTENRPAARLIDQSGLSVQYESLVDDFDGFLAAQPVHANRFTGKWQTDVDFALPGNIDFDLGGTHEVSAIALWNTDDRNAVDAFTLSLSDDPHFLEPTVLGDFVAEQLLTPQVFEFANTEGSFLRMTITTANGDRIRIGELALKVAANELLGDINGDGDVDFSDFLVLSSHFGQAVAIGSGGDLNEDGVVSFPDFLLLSSHFGQADSAMSAVPEPTALMQLVVGLNGLIVMLQANRVRSYCGK